MNLFTGIAALMTLLVVGWMVLPLLRSGKTNGVSSERLNADIHRDQLQALEVDLARGVISPQDFEATRDELQLRLLDDTESLEAAPQSGGKVFWSAKRTAVLIAITTPLMALGIYMQLGNPAAIDPVLAAKEGDQQVRKMVENLAAKLKENPDNPKGWAMLARSYKVMSRFDEAEQAFIKAGDLLNSEPDLLVDYADLLAVKAGNDIEGRPLALINKALAINPNHPMGLMMSGVAAYRRSDLKMAIAQWEKLLGLLEPGSPDAQQIEADINNAKELLTMPAGKMPPVPAGGAMTPEMINQMIERLAARLKENPDDPEGWAKLGRAYKVQGKMADAAKAYSKAEKIMDTDADLLVQYADVLASQAKGDFANKPTQLINKALTINPQHPVALMLAGMAAYQTGNFQKAIAHWEKVLTVLPPNSPDVQQVKSEIADAKAQMGSASRLK